MGIFEFIEVTDNFVVSMTLWFQLVNLIRNFFIPICKLGNRFSPSFAGLFVVPVLLKLIKDKG